MAKFKNKIANNKAKKLDNKKNKTFLQYKEQMQALLSQGQYVDAMDVMAEMAQLHKMDAECMYWGALCYYATGDLERATKWVNNALNFQAGKLLPAILVLLARICVAEGKADQSLQLVEKALNATNEFSNEAEDGLQQLMAEYESMPEARAKYPAVEAYYQQWQQMQAAAQAEAPAEPVSALDKLKNILAKTKHLSQENTAEEAEWLSEEAEDKDSEVAAAAEGAITRIMSQEISMSEKIKLLNAFAAGCYQADDYTGAAAFLLKALEMDGLDQDTLRNMVYVCLSQGQQEQAAEYASKLQPADFGLLYLMKQHW
ncbi:MAG: CDC27 family protein [Anaerovibrio sp.]|nr:CDC27 family protein [Anaerovibrio sp.]